MNTKYKLTSTVISQLMDKGFISDLSDFFILDENHEVISQLADRPQEVIDLCLMSEHTSTEVEQLIELVQNKS
jgi:Trm5-related predicted tRNA methylase